MTIKPSAGGHHRPARVTLSLSNWIALAGIASTPAFAAVTLLWKMDHRLTAIEQKVDSLVVGQIADHQNRLERLEQSYFAGK